MGSRLAYVDGEGRLCCRNARNGAETVLAGPWVMSAPDRTDERILYRWPTWSPAGDRIAAEGLAVGEDGVDRSVVWIVTADGVRAEAAQALSGEGLVYLQWERGGGGLLLLTGTGNGRLRLSRPGRAAPLVEGAPLFPSTMAPGALAVHVYAGDPDRARVLAFFEGRADPEDLGDTPGGFRSPCVLPEGEVVISVRSRSLQRIVAWRPRGSLEALPLEVGAGDKVALLPAGPGRVLVATGPAEAPGFERLDLVDGGCVERLWSEAFAAALPLGNGRLGIVTAEDSGSFTWRRIAPGETGAAPLIRFVPTEEEALRLGFFDQYAGSHPAVAPDGSALVVAGVDVETDRMPGAPHLHVVPLDGDRPRPIGPGRFAVWSPGPGRG